MTTARFSSNVAFTPSVKAIQARKGSRPLYERVEKHGSWQTVITPDLKTFIEEQQSIFLATASKDGQPTIQHRDGPAGFLRVLDQSTIAFVDYVGNRQYVTLGNLSENPKASLFLIDYAHQRRVKLWGEARVAENDEGLVARLMPEDYKARAEQVILFAVSAWDINCPQHIPRRFEADEVTALLPNATRQFCRSGLRSTSYVAPASHIRDFGMTPTKIKSNRAISDSQSRLGLGTWAILIVLLALLAASLLIAYLGWTHGSDTDVPPSGYVAMALGVIVSLGVGFGLMGLIFYSSRKGYDEPPVLLLLKKTEKDSDHSS